MGPGQKTQLQQQSQMAAARPGQPGAPAGAGPQQQPSAQGQGMGMGQNQAKSGQMGPAGGPMGQARQTGPTGNMLPTMVSKKSYLKLILPVFASAAWKIGVSLLINTTNHHWPWKVTNLFGLISIIPLLYIIKVSQAASHIVCSCDGVFMLLLFLCWEMAWKPCCWMPLIKVFHVTVESTCSHSYEVRLLARGRQWIICSQWGKQPLVSQASVTVSVFMKSF